MKSTIWSNYIGVYLIFLLVGLSTTFSNISWAGSPDHYHKIDLGEVILGKTVETLVEVCIDANKYFAYLSVGFGDTTGPLSKFLVPFSMGQLTSWSGSTLFKGSKCRNSSVYFNPTSVGVYTARVVGQVRTAGNDGYYRNDIFDFTAKATAPGLVPITELMLE